jgi:hypothetical protein
MSWVQIDLTAKEFALFIFIQAGRTVCPGRYCIASLGHEF